MEAYSKELPPAMAGGMLGQYRAIFVFSLGQLKYYLSTSSPNHFSEIFKYVPSSISCIQCFINFVNKCFITFSKH